MASDWPFCFGTIVQTAILINESDKLTLIQDLTLTALPAVETLLRGANHQWMSNVCITQYQSLLLNMLHLTFAVVHNLNPATLMPNDKSYITLRT